jgi:hypothetical protein
MNGTTLLKHTQVTMSALLSTHAVPRRKHNKSKSIGIVVIIRIDN